MSDENVDNKSELSSTTRSRLSRSKSKSSSDSEDDNQLENITEGSVRRRKPYKDSDEDDSESNVTTSSYRTRRHSFKPRRSINAGEGKACSAVRTCCGLFLFLVKTAVLLAFLAFLFLLGVGFFLAQTEFRCKLDELGPSLHSGIHGQDLAIKTTMDAVGDFCAGRNHDHPLTLVFWGPTGVGKTAFASIFTHQLDSNGQVVPAEHFKVAKYRDWYGNRLPSKLCVYTVDDVMTLREMEDIASSSKVFSFPLILVVTTSLESNLLNDSFIDWCANGSDEADFVYRGKDPDWMAKLQDLNPVLVPFLPLPRTSVKLCIEKTLNRLKMKYTEGDVEKIANEFDYFHNNKRLFSTIGCKRVTDKVFSVLSP